MNTFRRQTIEDLTESLHRVSSQLASLLDLDDRKKPQSRTASALPTEEDFREVILDEPNGDDENPSPKEVSEKFSELRRVAREREEALVEELFSGDSRNQRAKTYIVGPYQEVRRRAMKLAKETMLTTALEFEEETEQAKEQLTKAAADATRALQRFISVSGASIGHSQLPTE